MSQRVLAALQTLQPDSKKRIRDSIIVNLTQSLTSARYQLIKNRRSPSGSGSISVPRHGTQSLLQKRSIQAIRKLRTLPAGQEDNFTYRLNTQLLGGEQYPILTAVLGTVAGLASAGAGLLFAVATTALSASVTSQRVLARLGDEVWQVEEIGKSTSSGIFSGETTNAVHVGSYFLVDPHRAAGPVRTKGWLIHEERTELRL